MKYFPWITTAPWQRKEWEKCFPSIEGQWEVWRRPDHWRVEEERPLHLRSLWGPRVRAGERLGGGNVLRDTFLIFYLPPAGQRPPCRLFVWSRTLLHDHWGSEGSRAGQKKCGTVLSSSWCAGGAKWDQNSWPTQTPPRLTHPTSHLAHRNSFQPNCPQHLIISLWLITHPFGQTASECALLYMGLPFTHPTILERKITWSTQETCTCHHFC